MLEFTDDPQDNLDHFLIHGPFFDSSNTLSGLKGSYRYVAWCEAENQRYSDPDRPYSHFNWEDQIALKGRYPAWSRHILGYAPDSNCIDYSIPGTIGESELHWPNYLIN